LLVTDDGKLWSIGDNRHGQLGIDRRDLKKADEPMPVKGELEDRKVNLVAAGDDHSIVTTEDGFVFSWGANANGQLGVDRVDDQITPTPIRELQGKGVMSIACGARHSLFVSTRGTEMWACGSNVQGQLGIGQNNAAEGFQLTHPAIVHTLSRKPHIEVVQVVAAACHSLAITRVGEVYSWGDNSHGQLGFPPEGAAGVNAAVDNPATRNRTLAAMDAPRSSGVGRLWIPSRIVALSLYKVRRASTADTHTLVLAA